MKDMTLEIGKNISLLTFHRLSVIHGKTRQNLKHSENLGQRTFKDIEDKRETKVSGLGDWNSAVQLRRRG